MTPRAIFCVLLFVGWAQEGRRSAAATAAQSGDSEQHSFRIGGTVVDAMGGQPLARTQVTIGAQGVRGASQSTLTGATGVSYSRDLRRVSTRCSQSTEAMYSSSISSTRSFRRRLSSGRIWGRRICDSSCGREGRSRAKWWMRRTSRCATRKCCSSSAASCWGGDRLGRRGAGKPMTLVTTVSDTWLRGRTSRRCPRSRGMRNA
jgi:hypothetical protein